MGRTEHMASIQQEGPAWLNRKAPSSNIKRGYRKGENKQAVRKEDKDIVRIWQREVWLKPVWKTKTSKRSWIVMTLWTYTSSRDSPHKEFLFHSLLCQPCTNTQRWVELFQWENNIVLTRKKRAILHEKIFNFVQKRFDFLSSKLSRQQPSCWLGKLFQLCFMVAKNQINKSLPREKLKATSPPLVSSQLFFLIYMPSKQS